MGHMYRRDQHVDTAWCGVDMGHAIRQTHQTTTKGQGTMKLILLLCALVCTNIIHAKVNNDAVNKLQTTAKKIRTAKLFLSDEQIKHKIKQSMLKEQNKWIKARQDYLEVVRVLRELNVDVQVPDTLDELLMERSSKDADKLLMKIASHVKQHLHS
jgi:hypothetical protein